MLGALDDTGKPLDPPQTNGHVPNGTAVIDQNGAIVSGDGQRGERKRHPRGKPVDCVVMSVHNDTQPSLEKHSHSSSDLEVY